MTWFKLQKLTGPSLALTHNSRYFSTKSPNQPPWKVLFFGTDKFSLFSLQQLTNSYRTGKLIDRLEVVTTAKTGNKGKQNLVKMYCENRKLKVHRWPLTTSAEDGTLDLGDFDVGLVVSFGHLIPEHVIKSFKFGMLNVHASLLPRWRGAAPIIYALAKGDPRTGISIMKIEPEKFDIGDVLVQASVEIPPKMTLPELYDVLGRLGAQKLVETLENFPENLRSARPQSDRCVSYAPKISSDFARIKWQAMTSEHVCNLERALVGLYHVFTTWKGQPIKLIGIKPLCYPSSTSSNNGQSDEEMASKNNTNLTNYEAGFVQFDKQKQLLTVWCLDGKFISVDQVGVTGRKLMSARDFNNGYLKKEPPDSRYFE